MDISFHLDENEAKIYGFLEKNARNAFTTCEIYLNVFVDPMFRETFRGDYENEDNIGHSRYETVQKRLEMMVKEGKIAGRYCQGKFYYTV